MSKRLKRHLLTIPRASGAYFTATILLVAFKHLTGIQEAGVAITVLQIIFIIYGIWFTWRLYTGVYRDGDLLIDP